MEARALLCAVIWLGAGAAGMASEGHVLMFTGSNMRNQTTTYGVWVSNDLFGSEFIRVLNSSVNQLFNNTQNSPGSLLQMRTLAYSEALEPPNFFVFDDDRASAQRFLGYFAVDGRGINAKEKRQVIKLFDRSDLEVPAQPQVLAGRALNQFFYGLFILPASFALHALPWSRWLKWACALCCGAKCNVPY